MSKVKTNQMVIDLVRYGLLLSNATIAEYYGTIVTAWPDFRLRVAWSRLSKGIAPAVY